MIVPTWITYLPKLSPRAKVSWSDVATVCITRNIFPARRGISHPRHVVTRPTKSYCYICNGKKYFTFFEPYWEDI